MLKDIKNGAEIQACTKQPAIGSYIHKKEMVKIHGVMVGWFVGLFQLLRDPKKKPQRVFTNVYNQFLLESSSISDCNDLCFKIL